MAGKEKVRLEDSQIMEGVEEGWVEESTGFPPYWTPELGGTFKGTVMDVDREGQFPRIKILASETVLCKRGSVMNTVEEVLINPGEFFTVSEYGALNLAYYLGFEIRVKAIGNAKLPANKASNGAIRDMWEWKLFVSPQTKREVDEVRKLDAVRQREALKMHRLNAHAKLKEMGAANGEKQAEKQLDNMPF